jgi:hypothetical protein
MFAMVLALSGCILAASGMEHTGPRDLAPSDSVSAATPPDSTPAHPLELRLRRAGSIDLRAAFGDRSIEPVGLAIDAFGRMYVTDLAGRLLRLDPQGHPLDQSGSLGDDEGRLRHPGHVVTAGALGMALLDEENRRILGYDLFGHLQGVRVDLREALGDRSDSRVTPVALASDRTGSLYVADAEQDRVLVFDASGRLARVVSGFGSGPQAFHGLAGVAVGRRGDIVVTENATGRVQRLDASGRVQSFASLPGAGQGRLPVAVDDSLRIAVADERKGGLRLLSPAGRPLAPTVPVTSPSAIVFARDGSLWVAERGAGRVSRFVIGPAGDPK